MRKKVWVRLFWRVVIGLFLRAPNWFCLSVEVMVRRRFGERYLSWGMIVAAFCGVGAVLTLFHGFTVVIKPEWSYYAAKSHTAQAVWVALFWVRSVWHKAVMLRRRWRGEQWFSLSPGDPWQIWQAVGLSEIVLFRFVEPLLVLALAFPHAHIDGTIATWLGVSGMCLLCKRQQQHYADWHMVADMIDARLRSERLRAALVRDQRRGEPHLFTVRPAAPCAAGQERVRGDRGDAGDGDDQAQE